MGEVDYKRQTAIFDPTEHNTAVTIAGLGNIGSHTALALARMGIREFNLWDFDTIEAHNLSSQAYPVDSVGLTKADVLVEEMLRVNPNVRVHAYTHRYDGKAFSGNLLISAVDSMEARREIASNTPKGTFVIDGRMGGGQIEVWSQYAEEWPKTLDHDGSTDPCSARFISYTSYIIAGLIANQTKRHIMKQKLASRILLHTDTLDIIIA